MKNLRTRQNRFADFKRDVVGYCIDSDNRTIYALTSDLSLMRVSMHETQAPAQIVTPDCLKKLLQTSEAIGQYDVLLVEYIVEGGTILAALNSGHILRIDPSTSSHSKCVYKHDTELSSVKISPDQALIAVADEDSNIFVMSIDCVVAFSSNALKQNESLHKPVGVGWGSKETQFFGLDGRPSKESQATELPSLSDEDIESSRLIESSNVFEKFRHRKNLSTTIDWRADGQFIATLTFLPSVGKHSLKVWNRNLELQYMSEELQLIECGILTWIPDGRFICCVQRRDQQVNEIALFEKNGMIHKRITLPTMIRHLYVNDLAWSSDSKILAIFVNQFVIVDNRVESRPILLLYTVQNFQYYLKYSTSLERDCDYTMSWDPIHIKRLHVLSTRGSYREYDCCFEVTHCDQNSTVAVIDANKLLITPMSLCCIPPPFAALVLELDCLIHTLAINPKLATNMFIITQNNKLLITGLRPEANDHEISFKLELVNPNARELQNGIQRVCAFGLPDAQTYQNLTPMDNASLVATRHMLDGSNIDLIQLDQKQNEISVTTLLTTSKNRVIHVSRFHGCELRALHLVLDDSSHQLMSMEDYSTVHKFHFQPEVMRFTHIFTDLKSIVVNGQASLVSLDQDATLRFNEFVLSSSCTSFRVSDSYLIYTTVDDYLHFILLSKIVTKSPDENVVSWFQPIESGGTLIVTSEIDSKVILQMPRGNLEILHPRVLVLSAVTNLLDMENYVEAVKLSRRNRLNMNFIADYLLRLFDDVILLNDFANYIASYDPALLGLFIAELDDSDSIATRYRDIIKHIPARRANLTCNTHKIPDKVNRICSLITLPDETSYLQPKLLCLIKMKPKRVCEALELIHKLDKTQQIESLKFMLYFLDIDQLFLDALCTYNTDIALMVASVSNKDPKEYLALLDEFNSSGENSLRKYKMDLHVKRYDRAFDNLIDYLPVSADRSSMEKELVELVISKRIYKHALTNLAKSPDSFLAEIREIIWSKYADYLLEKRCYIEAGLAYSKANRLRPSAKHLAAALKCFLMKDDWEKAIAMLSRDSTVEDSFKNQHFKAISSYLFERGKCYEALFVAQLFEHGLPVVFVDQLSGLNWSLTECISEKSSKELVRQTISIHVLTSALANQVAIASDLKRTREQFDRLKQLIVAFFTNKLSNSQRGTKYPFESDNLSSIDGSEVSSSASEIGVVRGVARSGVSSIKTRKSSQSNKSQAPKGKRVNLKPDSRHEDLALILELKKFVCQQRKNHEDGMHLAAALFEYCPLLTAVENIRKINSLLTERLELSREILSSLWPAGPHFEQSHSLYRRFADVLSSSDGTYENVDFEVLLRPELPSNLVYFEF